MTAAKLLSVLLLRSAIRLTPNFAKEVIDQVPPLVDLHIDGDRGSSIGLWCDHDFAALCQQALF